MSEPQPVRAWRPPLLTRILAANAVVVLLGAVAGTLVTKSLADELTLGLVLGFAALGVALSLLINYFVLRRTLRPLSELTRAVGRIHDDLSGAPLPVTPGNDPDLDRLTSGAEHDARPAGGARSHDRGQPAEYACPVA